MGTTLDGERLFDEQQLEIEPGSISRDSVERTMAGLDGVLSIDLGGRGRVIRQRGVLTAPSRVKMDERVKAISAYMDGDTHVLAAGDGEEFKNLRMDSFKITRKRTSGSGVAVDYEIIYTQLLV